MNFFQIKSYLNHWLLTVDEHSIHSPYFFDLYTKVIKASSDTYQFETIENTRKKLLEDQSIVTVVDLGSVSNHFKTEKRTIADIASTSLAPPQLAQFISRLVSYSGAKQIVELGTSMGITSLYLSQAANSTIYTFEGNVAMINIALTNFEYFEKKNIHLMEGNINESLSDFLQTSQKVDFVLMDANHRYEPTLHYFNLLTKKMTERGVIMVDDIYHSEEMGRAWHQLKTHELVYGSVDLYRCGLLFFDTTLNKQHFVCSL